MKAIVAVDKNNGIGQGNEIPWRISDDFKHFKSVTEGSLVFMGRKTYQSIGRSLPNRINVILTRDKNLKKYSESDVVVNSITQLDEYLAAHKGSVFCIGGGELYKHYIEQFDEIYVTEVNLTIEGADTHFPEFDKSTYTKSYCRTTLVEDDRIICRYFHYSSNDCLITS